MGTKKWSLTTAKVLNRLRRVSLLILDGQPTEYERECVNRVWAFVGVERREYPANGLWENIKPQDRRDGVRRQLETRFSEGAFAREGKAAREAFTPDDLLAWGDQLLAEDAANAAVADAELEEEALRLFAPEEHEGDEAAEAAPASAPAAANVNSDTAFEPAAAAPAPAALAVPAFTFGAAAPPVAAPPAAPEPQSQKDEDHAKLIATVQWPNVYAATGVDGVTRHSGSLLTCRKYSKLAEGHERDLVHELRDYEASGGDLDAIRQHIDDAASAGVWEKFLINYKSFLRTGDDAAVEAHGSLAGSSVEVSPARSQDSEDEDEDDGSTLGDLGELERTLAINERTYGPDHPEVAITLNNLGAAYCGLGDYAKARDVLKRALKIRKRAYGPEHPEVAITQNDLGIAYYKLGDHAKQRDALERALPILVRTYGNESPQVADVLNDIGIAYEKLGDHAKARDVLEAALPIMERAYGSESKEVTITLNNLGDTYDKLGDYAKTRDVLEAALPIMERAYGSESKEVAITLNNLGDAYDKLGDYAKTRDVLEAALPIMERTLGIDHAIADITRKKIVELEKEHGLDHPKVGSALENVTNADLMREDIGSWACSGSVENVSKISWKSRSRYAPSSGGDRRSDLPSDSASLDHFVMDHDLANSGILLGEALSSNLSMVDS